MGDSPYSPLRFRLMKIFLTSGFAEVYEVLIFFK